MLGYIRIILEELQLHWREFRVGRATAVQKSGEIPCDSVEAVKLLQQVNYEKKYRLFVG